MSLPELAKLAVETYIKKGEITSVFDNLPKEFLERQAGVFVTIEELKKLRGCIGTYLPTRKNIAEEIIYNAIFAATDDYRFGPIQKEELPYLSYTIYILTKPEPVKNIKELDCKKFGIIVKTNSLPPKSGLLLPDLKGVETIEQQIQICCQKAGISPAEEKIIVSRLFNISDDDTPLPAIIYKFRTEKYQ